MQPLKSFGIDLVLDFPAVILLLIFFLGMYVLYKTQNADNDFDFAEMLRDDNGKPSSSRMATFVCLGASTWAIMYILVKTNGQIDPWIFVAYITIWSGAKVAERLIDSYMASRGLNSTTAAPPPPPVRQVKQQRAAPPPSQDDDEPAH